MIRSDRLGLAVLAGMILAIGSLGALTADGWLLLHGCAGLAITALVGIVCRRIGLPEGGVHLLQLGAGLVFVSVLTALEGLGGDPLSVLPAVGAEALDHLRASSAPMSANRAVRVIGASLIWLLGLIAEMVVISLARPAWVLPFLLTPYLAGALAIPDDLDFRAFALVALGLTVVLLADGLTRASLLRVAGLGVPGLRRSVLAGGAATAALGMAGAGLAGLLGPGVSGGIWEPFRGQGPIQMSDPTLDLRRNLEQPADRVVIRYRTDRPGGVHLRMTTLQVFDAEGWHLDRMELFGGPLPPAPGVTGSPPRRITEIQIDDFASQWLPLPYAPTSFQARGDWRHDNLTLAVLSGGGPSPSTVGLGYRATSVDIVPDVGDMLEARVGQPPDGLNTTALPPDLPEQVVELAREVTREARWAGQRATAIQEYLRSDRFRYSTEPAPGSGYEALTRFLFVDRVGYCEQFAASMAVLARAVGIPSRVAIGFLPGRRVGEGWEVSIRDMHAWPELYFADLGWVRFEPTPAITGSPPAWTDVSATPSATPSPSASPPSATSEAPTPSPGDPANPESPDEPGPIDLGSIGATGLVLMAAVGLLATGLLAAPWAIRTTRRWGRLGASSDTDRAEGAWEELRDTVWDAGWEWPKGSVRKVGRELSERVPPAASDAVAELAAWVERARYAESPGSEPNVAGWVTTIRESLKRGPHRLRSEVFPRSVWRRWRSGRA